MSENLIENLSDKYIVPEELEFVCKSNDEYIYRQDNDLYVYNDKGTLVRQTRCYDIAEMSDKVSQLILKVNIEDLTLPYTRTIMMKNCEFIEVTTDEMYRMFTYAGYKPISKKAYQLITKGCTC